MKRFLRQGPQDLDFGTEGSVRLASPLRGPNEFLVATADGGALVYASARQFRIDARGALRETAADTLDRCAAGRPAEVRRQLDRRVLLICGSTLTRYGADLQRDASFGTGGTLAHPDGEAAAYGVWRYDAVRRRYLVTARRARAGESTPRTRLTAFTEDGRLDAAYSDGGAVLLPDSLTFTDVRLGGQLPASRRYAVTLVPSVLDDGSVLLLARRGVVGAGYAVGRLLPDGRVDRAWGQGQYGIVETGFRDLGDDPMTEPIEGPTPSSTLAMSVSLPGSRVVAHMLSDTSNGGDVTSRTYVFTSPTVTSAETGPRAQSKSLTLALAGPHPVRSGAVARFAVSGREPGAALVVDLVDALGRRVAGAASVSGEGVTVETSGLSAGLYAVRAVSGAAHATRVFVVAR